MQLAHSLHTHSSPQTPPGTLSFNCFHHSMPKCTKQNSFSCIHARFMPSAERFQCMQRRNFPSGAINPQQPSSAILVLCNLHANTILRFLCFLDVTPRALASMACSPRRTLQRHSAPLRVASHTPPCATISCQCTARTPLRTPSR
jgi:hypothetical protein